AYSAGADLGGESCLEALARIHGEAGRLDKVAQALERLCRESSAEAIAERALALAETYVALAKRERARSTLEQALPRAADASALRRRLAALYRESSDFTALAELTEEEAELSRDPRERLGFLRAAALLHLEQRNDAGPAIPLLERA